MATSSILFVHLGPQLPGWLEPALFQSRLFNSCDIVLVAEARALRAARPEISLRITCVPIEDLHTSAKHEAFRRDSPQDRSFRNGFWTYTTERFFVAESAISALSLSNVVHVENDVLLYCDVAALTARMQALYAGLAVTFDNDWRCVPGFVYIPNERAIAAFTDFILQFFASPFGRQHGPTITDMNLLGAFRQLGPRWVDYLPIVPPDYPGTLRSADGDVPAMPDCYWRNFSALGVVFDAAALGQFLGGIHPDNDPHPSPGFVNEACVFDPRIVKMRMEPDEHARRVPIIETASGRHRVANLHVHSKNLRPFLSITEASGARDRA